jgi:hypothetical protein
MSEHEELRSSLRDQLMMTIARGKSIAEWARRNGVPESTARRWASDPDLRRQVEEWRRSVLDEALGWMAEHSMWAVKGITKLGKSAESESVQLRARRFLLLDQIAVSKFSNVEYRMAEIEEEIRVRNRDAARPSLGRPWPASGQDQ